MEIKEKLNKGEKLNCSETHVLLELINNKNNARIKAENFIEMEKELNRIYEIMTDNIELFGVDEVEKFISTMERIKKLEHFKQSHIGLYVTDKEPEKIFEEIFVNLIDKIGMDGEKTFSAVDYEYYKEFFNKGIKVLTWRIS